jgi:diaminohydroxyphosphoribosylaminopyrimidine deaminase/5-amino-6-(5-phosphoribosylamino)uracil reductase
MTPNRDRAFDQLRMLECLHLAAKGAGYVSPNPMVGAVVVKDGKVVGIGYHRRFGGPHAEVYALRQAKRRAKDSTLYVNLEPCCYAGKTPPCTDLIIQSKVGRVIVGMKDPNPRVMGRGIRRLTAAGIDVETGVLGDECRKLNEVFSKYIRTGMPFVALKIAQTLDGNIAESSAHSKWITSMKSRKLVHALRARFDAVLVGARTIAADDPRLTVHSVHERNPWRIVLDGEFTAPRHARVFTDRNRNRTILFVSEATLAKRGKALAAMAHRGVQVFASASETGRLDPHLVMKVLAEQDIASVLVEGGAETFSEFVEAGLADKVFLFLAPKILGDGLAPFAHIGRRSLRSPVALSRVSSWNLGPDILIEGYFKKF